MQLHVFVFTITVWGCDGPKSAGSGADWLRYGDGENVGDSGEEEPGGGDEDVGSSSGSGDGSGSSEDGGGGEVDDSTGGATDGEADGSSPALQGFIGSPCDADEDCDFEGGVCLEEGFTAGHCSAPCDRYCPDRDGFPVTFCIDSVALPDDSLTGGWCVSRCSFGSYPGSGCREDYGCRIASRFEEIETQTYSCVPGEGSDLSSCQLDLAARGIGFEPTVRTIEYPEGRADKVCEIVDPVWLDTPMLGVDLRYVDSDASARVLAGCEMAHALADTVEDVAFYGVSELIHIGTYNCRMIEGSDSLSEHSFANAIDIYGFTFDDGTTWTLIDDWEHDTDSPVTDAGAFLYEAAIRWHTEWIWNIILTPNYNMAHDNHFHVDLKPGLHDRLLPIDPYCGTVPQRD